MHQVVNELLSAAGVVATDPDDVVRVSSQVALGAQTVEDHTSMTDITRMVQVSGCPEADDELLGVRLLSGVEAYARGKTLGLVSAGVEVLMVGPIRRPPKGVASGRPASPGSTHS